MNATMISNFYVQNEVCKFLVTGTAYLIDQIIHYANTMYVWREKSSNCNISAQCLLLF